MEKVDSLIEKMENLKISSEESGGEKEKYKVGFCFDERMLLHKDVLGAHQESPERAMVVYGNLVLKQLIQNLIRVPCSPASDDDILLVHSKEYLAKIKETSLNSSSEKERTFHNYGEKDSYDNYATYESASVATGGLLNICRQILSNKLDHAFAIIRPPGHHADPSTAKGFCLFNSVAVAVRFLLKEKPGLKIAVLDWDVHHGDGTQKIFYGEKNPLFVSVHRHDKGKFYPFVSGFAEECGEGEGEGMNVNIPLDTKCSISKGNSCIGDAEYITLFNVIILPILKSYEPDVIFISCGFDAGENDFSGCLKCTPIAYSFMTRQLMNLKKNLIFALEGGYTLDTIKRCSESTIRTLLGEQIPWKDTMIDNYKEINSHSYSEFNLSFLLKNWREIYRPVPYVVEKLNKVIKINKKYWQFLEFLPLKEKHVTKFRELSAVDEVSESSESGNSGKKKRSKEANEPAVVPFEHKLRKNTIEEGEFMGIIGQFLIKESSDFYRENEEYIVFKIGRYLHPKEATPSLTNFSLRKLFLSMRTCLFDLKFNIESVKFTRLRANATKIAQLLNWTKDELKFDMNSNLISQILMLFFQHLNLRNKEVLKMLDEFIKKIERVLVENKYDIYNCDLIVIPEVIKDETNKEDNKKEDVKKKFKLFSKKEKIKFNFYLNGIKGKNVRKIDDGDKCETNTNFIDGLISLKNFIKESVLN